MIPVLDLKAQYAAIEQEIDAAIKGMLRSTEFILGPAVRDLEQRVAAYCGCKYGIGVASGTDALRLTLTALGIGPGDEVITTPFTFIATANTISHCGARLVFVDIDPRTFNIDPAKIEAAITERTKAIVPVHLYGQPADMDPIMELAERHGLFVVEDCTPYESPDVYHVYHQYTIRAERRDALAAYLKERGIGTMVYYPLPLHLQGLYASLGYGEGSLPESEAASREVLSLPMYPEITEEQQMMVVEAIRRFYGK